MDFETVYALYAPKIYRLCLGYTGDADMAKDLLQETFIAVWSGIAGFRGDSAIGTWIYRIASNKCLRAMAVEARMPRTELPYELKQADQESTEEKHAILLRCISSLREADRLLISLELEGVAQSEIARIVGLSDVNVRVRLFRIREKLKQMLLGYEQFR